MYHYVTLCTIMGAQRRWTTAEDARLREASRVAWPTLAALARELDRTAVATRMRASRLGARRPDRERMRRLPAVETERACRRCGAPFAAIGRRAYCGPDCAVSGPAGHADT